MNKHFKEIYYLKKLYFDAGRTVRDYLYAQYINMIDRRLLERLYDKIFSQGENVYCFHDSAGRAVSLLCYITAGKAVSSGDVFIYKDDYFTADKVLAVYLENGKIFIYSNKKGNSMKEYYHRTDCTKHPISHYIKLAERYFEKSEYIAKRRYL